MSDGSIKNIEDVKVGDSVKSWDEKTNKILKSNVIELIQPLKDDIIIIEWNNGSNKNTFDHPYYVKDKGWCSYKPNLTMDRYNIGEIQQLEVGDIIYQYNNDILEEVEVNLIKEELGEVQTYIIKLNKYHTFFANSILTHNK